jgi:hypothetical protein
LGCAAHNHGVTDRQILHALDHARLVADLDDDTSPARTLVLGLDPAGNMLEPIVLHFDDGRDMVIHGDHASLAVRTHQGIDAGTNPRQLLRQMGRSSAIALARSTGLLRARGGRT